MTRAVWLLVIAGLAAATAIALGARNGEDPATATQPPVVGAAASRLDLALQTRPQPRWHAPPRPAGESHLLVRVHEPLHTTAGVVAPSTPLGSPTWLLVLGHRGPAAAVLVPTEQGGQRAQASLAGMKLRWTVLRVDVDLGDLRLSLLRSGRPVASFPVAAGRERSPTPTGRFAVTDRVAFGEGGPYGRFALGLSARQPEALPAGWTGGDQIAIHGTPDPSSIGSYASLGCVRLGDEGIELLRRMVPLGAPVTVHA